jgi:carboxyl-terminal processing protease
MAERALRKGRQLNEQGDWSKAYSECYSWLNRLYPENKEYKDISEKLLEKVAIERSLQDAHGKKSIERHAGIKPKMLVMALKKMDFNYVNVIDYSAMQKKAVNRCRLLGEVLQDSKKKLAFTPNRSKIRQWNGGIKALTYSIENNSATKKIDDLIELFERALILNEITIALPKEVVTAQFSEAALDSLDPYTNLIWPKVTKEFHKSLTQRFSGIGIRISKSDKTLKVLSLIPNTPAYSSGLDAGDTILAVDGCLTDSMSTEEAVSHISGPIGTDVTLTVHHITDDTTEDITITRQDIVVPAVRSLKRAGQDKWQNIIDTNNSIGYMRISNFVRTTIPEMQKMLHSMEQNKLNGLVVDLRFNRGGLLSSAVEMVDMFVKKGPILKSQPRWGVPSYMTARPERTHPDYPLVVLINGSSASASEIVAGALQDPLHKRATIVGSRSFGKGSVQEITDYPGSGAQLKYTTAYYHLPSNQRVKNRYIAEREGRKDWGIKPDVKIELKGSELKKMIEVQEANNILARTDNNGHTTKVKRFSIEETIDSDPQLAVALLVIKAKMIKAGLQVN